MTAWVLVISMFSPGGEFIKKYTEGPIDSHAECESRRREFRAQPDLLGVKIRTLCIRLDKSTTYSQDKV